jgi:hypothetical protein
MDMLVMFDRLCLAAFCYLCLSVCSPPQGNMFGSSFNLAAAGLGDLPSDILVPGVAVFSRRALPLAAWTNGLEISGDPADSRWVVMLVHNCLRWRASKNHVVQHMTATLHRGCTKLPWLFW